MTRPIVFLGPSLPRDHAEGLLDADYRPPIRQGDLLRAAEQRPPAIAIIDGVFTRVPTVRHREILWVLAQGIPVFGAASMGALRAAELHPFGMIGHGLIYRWYRRFPLLPDDAVAVVHAPGELGSTPLSSALVDLRRTFQAARRAGDLSASRHRELEAAAQALHFVDRSIQALEPTPHEVEALARHQILQKRHDAMGLLGDLADRAKTNNWPIPKTKKPPVVDAWLDDLGASGFDTHIFAESG